MSKVVTILGGNGYVAGRCIDFLLRNVKDVKVYAISRSGKQKYGTNPPSNERLEHIHGDCLNPNSFENIIRSSTGIIHSIGILLAKEEQYHQVNKETCLRVANIANKNPHKTNFVYISAEKGLPYPMSKRYSGYIRSKRECEQLLLNNYPNLNPVILRPGLVKSNDKLVTLPFYYSANAMACIDKYVLNKAWKKGSEALELPSKGIDINILAKWLAAGALGLLEPKKIYSNYHMNEKANYEAIKM